MEKRIQQLIDSTIKALIGMITLRPIARILFSFKGALTLLTAIAVFRILDALISTAGQGNILGLFDFPREINNWFYAFINVAYYVALISVFVLLKQLLSSYRDDETDRALTLALRQGLITDHEFEQKRLVAQKVRFTRILSTLEEANVLTTNARVQLARVVDDSHRRWELKEALLQAHKSGAIDEAFYTKRLNELGLQ